MQITVRIYMNGNVVVSFTTSCDEVVHFTAI